MVIMKNDISVIIPTFNRADFLRKAIESVLSQTYRGFELIVIDDGSTDNTYEIVSEFKNNIVYIKQKNIGAASARNTGIKRAKNKFLAFLDSDDCWDKEKLAIQIDEMQKNPSYLVSHTQEHGIETVFCSIKRKNTKNIMGIFSINACRYARSACQRL